MTACRREFLRTVGGSAGICALAGCVTPRSRRETMPREGSNDEVSVDPRPPSAYGYTHLQPDGNRRASGRGDLPDADPIDVELQIPPEWLVALPEAPGSVWAAVGTDGRAQGFRLEGRDVEQIQVDPGRLPSGMPPLLAGTAGTPTFVTAPETASSTTHPIPVDGDRILSVTDGGDLVLWDDDEIDRLRIDALPDARLVRDESGRVALLTSPTERYDHGVLGDSIEADRVSVVDPGGGSIEVVSHANVSDDAVIEGIAPIWADLTGDGTRDLVVTLSDADEGARVAAFGTDGERIASGPAIGRGHRWRHQLAVAPFVADGPQEIAVVRTPHIGGTVEFYRLDGESLDIVGTVSGYSTHVIGSRNLDGGLVGDLDDDGRLELLVPTQQRTELAGLRRTTTGAEEAWRLPLGGTVHTNLVGVRTADDTLIVGVGREDGTVRVWPP